MRSPIDVIGLYGLAERGQYFRAISPTPGTGIAQSIQASFSATNGVALVRNLATGGDTTRIYMDYIRLIPTVVPASATRSELLLAIDNISRFSSGGSTLTVRNVNMDDTTPSIAEVRFGALTLAAESAAVRRISRAQQRTVIPVVFEEYILAFVSKENVPQLLGGGASRIVTPVGPAILGPGDDFILHLWHPGNVTTAASWEVEIGWAEVRKSF